MLLVDTSVWSLAFRRDQQPEDPRVDHLHHVLSTAGDVAVTGIIVQELLQGMTGPRQRATLVDRLAALPSIDPHRADHIRAAEVRNACRRGGVQLGTIDALLAALCLRHDLVLLTADRDFEHASAIVPLRLWSAA